MDLDDAIAKKHDEAYAFSKSFSDVHEADAQAIKEFAFATIVSPQTALHSGVSAGVLGVKYLVEGALGYSIYPDMATAEKRPRVEVISTGGGGEGKKGHGISRAIHDNLVQICRSSEALAFGKAVVFKKSFILTTWAFKTGPATLNATEDFILKHHWRLFLSIVCVVYVTSGI